MTKILNKICVNSFNYYIYKNIYQLYSTFINISISCSSSIDNGYLLYIMIINLYYTLFIIVKTSPLGTVGDYNQRNITYYGIIKYLLNYHIIREYSSHPLFSVNMKVFIQGKVRRACSS